MSEPQLQGRVAIVTGASRGLGQRIAEALAKEGVTVALLARNADAVAATAAAIGGGAFGLACDIGDPASVRAAFAEIVARAGRIDILVNNAAITELHAVEHASDESILSELAINLAGPIFCCRAAIPHLRTAGGGDIINISSESVRNPFPHLVVYAASKAGLETFSAGLRSELAPDEIRVTTLRVGHMGESGISAHWGPEARAAWNETIAKSGHLNFTGGSFNPSIAANALVDLVKMSRSVNVDLMEIRSAEKPH